MEQEETTVQITAEPKRSQLVEHEGQVYKTIQEGKAFILVPPGARTSVDPQAKAKGKAGQHAHTGRTPLMQREGG